MKHIPLLLTALALALSATAGYAEEGTRDAARLARYQPYAGEPVKNIPYYTPMNWEVIDDQNILVTMRPKVAYLMQINGPCVRDHRGSPVLVISSAAGRVSAGFDRITVGGHMTCIIDEIRPIDLVAMRAADKAKKAETK